VYGSTLTGNYIWSPLDGHRLNIKSDKPSGFRSFIRPVSPEHAAAIGYVAIYWSLVENSLGDMVGVLLGIGVPEVSHSITAELSTLAKAAMIRSLIDFVQNQEWLDEWDAIATRLNNLRNRRNDVIHSYWENNKEGVSIGVRTKARGTVKFLVVKEDAADLGVFSEELIDLADVILDFCDKTDRSGIAKLMTQFRTSPPRDRGQSRAARDQAQARQAKKARKRADRANPKNRAPKTPKE
jgi:hypothetical protein